MAHVTKDEELDFFKRQPLGYLLMMHFGFAAKNQKPKPTAHGDVDAESFSRDGMKVQTFRASSGHYMWKSHDGSLTNRSGGNSGTIVDIAVKLDGDLGRARQHLRQITGYSANSTTSTPVQYPPITSAPSAPVSSPLDAISTTEEAGPTTEELEAAYAAFGPAWQCHDAAPDYLAGRHLTDIHPIFHCTFRVSQSRRGTIAFPYYRTTESGFEFAGHEAKNIDFKGYSKGGHAGVWSAIFRDPTVMVVAESPIDAMSFAALAVDHEDFSVGYIALRSGSEQVAVELLKGMVEHRGLKQIVVATDNDAAGMTYAAKIMSGLHSLKDRVSVRYRAPLFGQTDWNDSLAEHVRRQKVQATGRREASPAEVDPSAGIEMGSM
ncbi:toprim domain-containing protein [Cereibacter azotoformans]|uniref:Toprim domain-containing protein n=1 Tax=Cereibacter azotoformans TaxID=43057 RepID=A0A2T5K712_9RHOB|nr:toprim domain-containing protein [Cereibacter azotoformans]MBO4169536.1 toprim domain-containing protein [Cereibacter azotoformans]PTR18213.1 Toprim domain-containing protein [Cereibacter azotoformans]